MLWLKLLYVLINSFRVNYIYFIFVLQEQSKSFYYFARISFILYLDVVAQLCHICLRRLTMSKTATVRARIEPDLKQEVEQLFHELGLSITD